MVALGRDQTSFKEPEHRGWQRWVILLQCFQRAKRDRIQMLLPPQWPLMKANRISVAGETVGCCHRQSGGNSGSEVGSLVISADGKSVEQHHPAHSTVFSLHSRPQSLLGLGPSIIWPYETGWGRGGPEPQAGSSHTPGRGSVGVGTATSPPPPLGSQVTHEEEVVQEDVARVPPPGWTGSQPRGRFLPGPC